MERIGIYGGTFNPPHIGHISAARQAIDLLNLNKLLLIPDRIAPHKELPQGSADPQQRLQMLKTAVSDDSRIHVSDIELSREGVSYTYLTVLELRKQYPNSQLFLLMGTDMFLSFLTWREPNVIMDNVTIGVLYRGNRDERQQILEQKAVIESQDGRVELIENQVAEISSTQLRAMLVFGCAEPYLPVGIDSYIRKNQLYGTEVSYAGCTLAELEDLVIRLCKPNRAAHILGCRDTAVAFAERYAANVTDAARSALLHDITKSLSVAQQLTLCGKYGIVPDNFCIRNSEVFHALTGSIVAQKVFQENAAVVSAIECHTTGKVDMSLLDKILYLADMIEPTRNFPGVEDIRATAKEDLDRAVIAAMRATLQHLQRKGLQADPRTQEALKALRGNEII